MFILKHDVSWAIFIITFDFVDSPVILEPNGCPFKNESKQMSSIRTVVSVPATIYEDLYVHNYERVCVHIWTTLHGTTFSHCYIFLGHKTVILYNSVKLYVKV